MGAVKVIVLGFGPERDRSQGRWARDTRFLQRLDCRVIHVSAEPMRGVIPFAQAVERVKALPPDAVVAVMAHHSFRVANEVPPFDLVMLAVNGGEHAAGPETIPLNLMRAAIAQAVEKGFGARLLRLAKASAATVVCAGPPAPRDDLHAGLPGDESVAALPGSLRLKLWTLQQQALAGLCRRNGIAFLANPVDARLASGFLKPRHHANKGHGANSAYGTLVLEQLSRVMVPRPDLPAALG